MIAAALGDVLEALANREAPLISAVELLAMLAGAALVFAFLRAVRWGFRLMPLPARRRAAWARGGVVLEIGAWLFYTVSAVSWSLAGHPSLRLAALAGLLVVVVAASWFLVRDYLAGVILRTEQLVSVGDLVIIDGTEGTVRAFRGRVIEIEVAHGDRVFMPWRRVGQSALVRRSTERLATRHTFVISIPEARSVTAAQSAVREAVLLSHWTSPGHEPKVRPLDGDRLEITVHALNDARGADIEAAIRRALGA